MIDRLHSREIRWDLTSVISIGLFSRCFSFFREGYFNSCMGEISLVTGSWKGRMRIRVSQCSRFRLPCFEYGNPSLPSPGYSPEAEKNPLWCPVSKDTLFLHEVMRGSCLTAGWKEEG